jgi:hypothetical protein
VRRAHTSAVVVPTGLVVLVVFVVLTAATGEADKRRDADRSAGQRPEEPPTGDGRRREAGCRRRRANDLDRSDPMLHGTIAFLRGPGRPPVRTTLDPLAGSVPGIAMQQLEQHPPGQVMVSLDLTEDGYVRSFNWARWHLGIPLLAEG